MDEMRSAISACDCQLHRLVCAFLSVLRVDIRRRSRSSTEGGTSPEIFPPSPKTSLTSRELMNE